MVHKNGVPLHAKRVNAKLAERIYLVYDIVKLIILSSLKNIITNRIFTHFESFLDLILCNAVSKAKSLSTFSISMQSCCKIDMTQICHN